MKSVAVVGAGPGGLVAAKALLHQKDQLFKVTVFEKADRLGGLWNLQKGTSGKNGFLSPETPTNLSKFTVSFSDLSWDSLDLGVQENGRPRKHEYSRVPMFPKAWMAGQYLEKYADKYRIRDKIKFETEVSGARRRESADGARWELLTSNDGKEQTYDFDYLIIASGFFSKPRELPKPLTPELPSGINVVHCSRYRSIDDLIPSDSRVAARNKILIIGGGNSSGEVAGTVAQHLSSAVNTTNTPRKDLQDVEIIHVTPRPLYALPPFVPAAPAGPGFVPLDLRLYDFDARPGEIQSYGGKAPEDIVPIVHGFIRAMVGSDQSDLGASALIASSDGGKTSGAAYVALSENYSEFVRSGLIKPVAGRVKMLDPKGDAGLVASIDAGSQQTTVDGIAAVIHASGYTPAPALDWLPQDVLEDLEYDANSPRLPLILDMLQTYNSTVPDIGFIGFYEGPYWGVMEMQARLLTELWASSTSQRVFKNKDRYYETKGSLRSLRQDMDSKDRLVPQYWFSDYLGYMDEAASDLGLQHNDHPFEHHQGPTTPARYLSSDTSAPEAARTVTDLQRTMAATKNGAFVARATFRALQGNWKIMRKISSATGTLPSGLFIGAANFAPRTPSASAKPSGLDDSFDGEYLYSEQGTFNPDNGTALQASRHYVYRYREVDDGLNVWFVKPENPRAVDYLYHDVVFDGIEAVEGEGTKQWARAHAEHLCEKDLYKTEYEFTFRGIAISSWTCRHTVKGPAKDYVSEGVYER